MYTQSTCIAHIGMAFWLLHTRKRNVSVNFVEVIFVAPEVMSGHLSDVCEHSLF